MQKDNVRNQRENVILMIANAQARLGIPAGTDPVSLFMLPYFGSNFLWTQLDWYMLFLLNY